MMIFDIETNSLLPNLKTSGGWGALRSTTQSNQSELHAFRPHENKQGIQFLKEQKVIAGHNIVGFDLPALFKMHGDWDTVPNVIDTQVTSRLLWPERPWGHHLKGWGLHLGNHKGDFEYTVERFAEFSEEMLEYCIQDVMVNADIYTALEAEYGE